MINANHSSPRTPWQVTRSVWSALFLREVSTRIMSGRFAWFWMLFEPIAFVVLMVAVREFLGRIRFVVNAEFIPWLLVGITVFMLFRDGLTRSIGAIKANQGLLAYRQVKPIDSVLVRLFLEGMLKIVVFMILIFGASLMGHDIIPFDPLGAMFVWGSVWLLGLGLGLIVSVATTLVEEVGIIVRMINFPLLFLSGVILPLNLLPHYIHKYVLYNPVAHGVESLRLHFFAGYHTLEGVDIFYLYYWILPSMALGLALHVKFATRLRAK